MAEQRWRCRVWARARMHGHMSAVCAMLTAHLYAGHCLQAAQAGPDLAAGCAARHAHMLMQQRDCPAAAAVLATHGVAASAAHLQLYRDVALEVLAADMQHRQPQAEEHTRCVLSMHSPTHASTCCQPTCVRAAAGMRATQHFKSATCLQSHASACVRAVCCARHAGHCCSR